MRSWVAAHPHLTNFIVIALSVVLSIPLWIGGWILLAMGGNMFIAQGCGVAYPGGCDNDSLNFTFVVLALIPFFFAIFIWQSTRVASLITDALLRWAGLNPRVALA